MLSIWVTSAPVMRNISPRRSNCGAIPFFFLSRPSASLLVKCYPGCDLLFSGDTPRAAGRIRPSASDKTHSHSVPASAKTTDLPASCPPGLRAISSSLAFTRESHKAAADRVLGSYNHPQGWPLLTAQSNAQPGPCFHHHPRMRASDLSTNVIRPEATIVLAKFSASTLAMMQPRSAGNTIAGSCRQPNFYSARKASIG
jgi:hypothetical protein